MQVDAYIERAASELRDAAAALQDEVHELQREVYDEQVHLKHEASDKEYVRMTLKVDETSDDQKRRSEAAAQREELRRIAQEKRQEADRRGNDAATAVRAKTNLISRLNSVASQLESLAASAR